MMSSTVQIEEERNGGVEEAEAQLKGILTIDYLAPDYYALHAHIFEIAETEAAAADNRFIHRNFAGGTPERDSNHGA